MSDPDIPSAIVAEDNVRGSTPTADKAKLVPRIISVLHICLGVVAVLPTLVWAISLKPHYPHTAVADIILYLAACLLFVLVLLAWIAMSPKLTAKVLLQAADQKGKRNIARGDWRSVDDNGLRRQDMSERISSVTESKHQEASPDRKLGQQSEEQETGVEGPS